MKIGGILLAAAVVGGIIYFGNLGIGAADVQFILGGVQIQGLTTIQVQLIVQNVSNADFKINSMSGTVTLNGNMLGNVSSFPATPIVVKANSQVPINVTLNLSLLSVPGVVQQLLAGTNQQLNFVVTGNVNLNSLVVPFTVQDSITY